MPYIDATYYKVDFMGSPYDTDAELGRAILRASEVIDVVTQYKLVDGTYDIATVHPFIQAQVKKATAMLVEHYTLNGGYDATRQTDISGANLGGFNYSVKDTQEVPENVMMVLSHTGLLHAGVKTNDHRYIGFTGWYY